MCQGSHEARGRHPGVRQKSKNQVPITRLMKTWIKNPMPWLTVCAVSLAAACSSQALTTEEATGVLYLKQEEKVARDLYQALGARWDQATFRNIALAEQRHMDAVDGLIVRYGLSDTTPAAAGKFTIPELQKLYDELLAQGQSSLTEALRVGVAVEQADIDDLKAAIAVTSEASILRVFGNLLRGSTQHLSAFETVLASGSGSVSAVTAAGAAVCPQGANCGAATGCSGRSGQGMQACGAGQGGCTQDGVCPLGNTPRSGQECPAGKASGKGGANAPVTVPNRGGR